MNLNILKRIFGTSKIEIKESSIIVSEKEYPVIDGVIILLDQDQYTPLIKQKLKTTENKNIKDQNDFAPQIQYTFGAEWQRYNTILDEHKKEFDLYFDIVNLDSLKGKIVCDLGCGIGRWSHFVSDYCDTVVLVDFSDAIFEAKKNLQGKNCIFLMADIKKLPIANNAFDFVFSLGVLHHLPSNCLNEVRNLKKLAPEILIYLYYALDNRPFHFQVLLKVITAIRLTVCKIKNKRFREFFTKVICLTVYFPLIGLGSLLSKVKLDKFIPLYEGYKGDSFKRIEQDVYDRFFTEIEQRVTKKEILTLKDTFSEVKVADTLPYWHFYCKS